MILRYELPKEAEQVISLTDNERIYYAVPVDIDDAGNFLEDSYFIVTNRRLFVVEKGSIKEEYDVSKCIDVKAEAKIGGGLLVINFDGVPKQRGAGRRTECRDRTCCWKLCVLCRQR